jgi:GNAT superfamily N-acetyltransferase
MPQPDNAEVLVPGLAIRGAGLDHWSEIRHVHASAFRRLAGPAIDEQQCEAFVARIYEPDYTVTLQTHDLIVAWLDNRPIGTAGWVPFDQRGTIARIASVYVSPQFTRLGIGRRLVTAAEARARPRLPSDDGLLRGDRICSLLARCSRGRNRGRHPGRFHAKAWGR